MGHKKTINNIHDKSYKDLYSNKIVFLNLVKEMLKASWTKDLDEDNLILVDKQYILSDYEENEADIVYRANVDGEEVIFYTLLEFQSTVDYRMPLRLFFYINEILREYIKNSPEKERKNRKGFKVPAIVPIVLYNATRKWNVPRYFRDIVNQNQLFGDNIVNFKYELFDVNHQYTKAELIKNNNITSAIFLLDQKVEPLEFFNRLKSVALQFNRLTNRERELLKHWIRNTVDEEIVENAVKILEAHKEGVEKMVANNAFIIKEMKEKVEKEGIEKGIEKGVEKEKENSRLKDIGRVKNLLIKKFGILNDDCNQKIENLDNDKLNSIIEDILDIKNLEDVEKYF